MLRITLKSALRVLRGGKGRYGQINRQNYAHNQHVLDQTILLHILDDERRMKDASRARGLTGSVSL
jgi:hypothetical protein